MFFFLSNLYFAMTRHNRQPDLPYKSHPLYFLRRVTIWVCIIGLAVIILAFLSAPVGATGFALFVSSIFLMISLIVCAHDLITYAAAKITWSRVRGEENTASSTAEANDSRDDDDDDDEDDNDSWPSKRLIIVDALLTLIHFFLFFFVLAAIAEDSRYSYGMENIIPGYAALASLVASILHVVAFWKELMARKKKQWKKSLKGKRCVECGFAKGGRQEGDMAEDSKTAVDEVTRILSKLGSGSGTVKLPGWATLRKEDQQQQSRSVNYSDIEPPNHSSSQPLLATPNSSADLGEIGEPSGIRDYGVMSRSTESLASVPETVVRKKEKGKGKRREVLVDTADLV